MTDLPHASPPEFSRPERLDTIGTAPRRVEITATEAECAALAWRFGLIGIDRLAAVMDIHREGDIVVARGRVTAAVAQACIATDEPVPATVDEVLALRFLPDAAFNAVPDAEIELQEDDCDTVAYSGGSIDLGEAAAETMILSLDPYVRSPDAEEILRAAGVKHEEEVGPFSALASLKDKLGKDKLGG
ncbi:MAG: DUF177 domain-containing protein [Sphingomonas sp.]|jgi:uncharacterized metal-binding protein YceD (DUF177 family)